MANSKKYHSKRKKEYDRYLRSETWKEKRIVVLERSGHKCEECGNVNSLHVHHLTYDRFGGDELPEDLQVLCYPCHMKKHPDSEHAKKYFKKQNRIKKKERIAFFKSQEWARLVCDHIELAGNICENCEESGIFKVRHRDDSTIGKEEPGDLIGLCKSCFEKLYSKKGYESRKNKGRGRHGRDYFKRCVMVAREKYGEMISGHSQSFMSLATEIFFIETGEYPEQITKKSGRRYLLDVLLGKNKTSKNIFSKVKSRPKKKKKRKKKKKPGVPSRKKAQTVRTRKFRGKKGNIRGDAMTQEKLDELTAAYKKRVDN